MKVVEQIAIALRTNRTLKILNLSDNTINENNAIKIRDALITNNTLTTFNLSATRLKFKLTNIVESLKINTTLKSLNLSWNAITDFNGISDALKPNTTLTELNLEHNNTISLQKLTNKK